MLACSAVRNPSPEPEIDSDRPAASSLTLQERKLQVVRTAIWDAATDLFAEKGYDETTIDDIARRAGVSRRSFFRYFSSKSDLMAYGVTWYGMYLGEAIEACPAGCSPREMFRRTVFEVAQRCASHPRTRKIMQVAAKYPDVREAQQTRAGELREGVEAAFAKRFGGCRGKGDMTPGVLGELTLSILAVIFHLWFEQGQPDISVTAEQVLATLGRLVCDDRKLGKKK
jgi:AcrR family transcriptional regulator